MKFMCLLLFTLFGTSAAIRRPGSKAKVINELAVEASTRPIHIVSSERIINKIFNDADSNHDGNVDFREVYELVLKMYVQLNRQAPIPPPSKKRVMQLFLNSDVTHNNQLNRDEFKGLANILARRAVSRVLAYKLVTLVCAPLLAAYFVGVLTGKEWLPEIAKALVPDAWEEKVLPVITSANFCRTVLIVVLVSTLGNFVLSTVNWILDMSLEDEDKDERLKDLKS